MDKAIYFDMDGTIADFYGVEGWLSYLIAGNVKPYRDAKPLVNMRSLSAKLKMLQLMGYRIGIISWLSKSGTDAYNQQVTKIKLKWLKKHLGSVDWDEIKIVPYGTPKQLSVDCPAGLLFDDEEQNRNNWIGRAENVNNILETLNSLIKEN